MELNDDIIDLVFDEALRSNFTAVASTDCRYAKKEWEDTNTFEKVIFSLDLAKTLRLVSRKFSQLISPFCICMAMPNAEMRTKMIIGKTIHGFKKQVSTSDFLLMYQSVFHYCSNKPPFNQSELIYNSVQNNQAILKILPTQDNTHAVALLERIFKYLDRFYVNRLCLPRIRELLLNH